MTYNIEAPLTKETVDNLKAGDMVKISGTIYTARDAAHKLMVNMLQEGIDLPFDVKNQIIYYVGPCPARPGQVMGSAGPTTSSRMDAYAPKLLELGLAGMIGKGLRSKEVVESMMKHGAVYFGAIGGAAALISKTIVREEIIAFPELGPEALRKLTVIDFPAVVVIDRFGKNLYESGRNKYCSAI
ncbi:MAG: hydro-lyase family enzyme Fe-S type, tartrate/fumarate subfamily [Eubacterium sp.]|jgi:fumarate hydratase subunit beta|nr:hydro-lyase family enzyme Fe-S type, tartrate/fumarate subfamily [Eubacterium sp.]